MIENYQEFIEKKICLRFPNEYYVLEYDKTKFYRETINTAIQNTKGVDYIVKNNNKLIFIEISDYRGKNPPPHANLVDEVMQKTRDSIVGLFSAQINEEQEFLKYANCLFTHPIEEFVIIFILEEDSTRANNSNANRANMALRLRKKLNNAFKAQFYACDCSNFNLVPNIEIKLEYIAKEG
jgi:hypothetical protein